MANISYIPGGSDGTNILGVVLNNLYFDNSSFLSSFQDANNSALTPASISSSQILFNNTAGYSVAIAGSNFKISVNNSSSINFNSFQAALLAGTASGTVNSITLSKGVLPLVSLTLSTNAWVIQSGNQKITISGALPNTLDAIDPIISGLITSSLSTSQLVAKLVNYNVSQIKFDAGDGTSPFIVNSSATGFSFTIGNYTASIAGKLPFKFSDILTLLATSDKTSSAYQSFVSSFTVSSANLTNTITGLSTYNFALANGDTPPNLRAFAMSQLGTSNADIINIPMNITATGSAQLAQLNINAGAGNDTVNFGGILGTGGYIDGGSGTNTISFKNFETSQGYNGYGSGISVDLVNQYASSGYSTFMYVTNFQNVTGSNFSDTISGGAGANILNGGGSGDFLTGNGGTDTLFGGAGSDTFYINNNGTAAIKDLGFGGADSVEIDAGSTVTATMGASWVATYSTYNNATNNQKGTILANNFNVDLSNAQGSSGWTVTNLGNATGVTLIGSYNGDVLKGGSGGDILNGRMGADTLTGGAGNDTFIYTNPSQSLVTGFDTITDFSATGTDLLKIGHTVSTVKTARIAGTGTLSTDLMSALASNFSSNCAALVTISSGTDAGSYVVISNHSTGSAFLASADAVIKVQSGATVTASSFIV